MKKIFILMFVLSIVNFNFCHAIEPPDAIKDHIANKKNPQVRIEELKNIIKNSPNDISSYKELIKLLENANLKKEAIDAYITLAAIYENINTFDQAKSCYENALKLDPESEFLQNKSKTVHAAITTVSTNYYTQTTVEPPQKNQTNFINDSSDLKKVNRKKSSGNKLTQKQLDAILDSGMGKTKAGNETIQKILKEQYDLQ